MGSRVQGSAFRGSGGRQIAHSWEAIKLGGQDAGKLGCREVSIILSFQAFRLHSFPADWLSSLIASRPIRL